MAEKKLLCNLTYSIAEYVKKWGNAASIALSDPSCHIFSCSEIDGIIGYREIGNSMIVLGDPVCHEENKIQLAAIFHDYCNKLGKNIAYISTSENFTDQLTNHKKYSALEVGKEVILNPEVNILDKKGKYPSLLRNKFNQLEKSDIKIHEYYGQDKKLEKQMINLAKEWSKNRKGAQVFTHQIDLFKNRDNKRWFYAYQQGEVIGLLMLDRVDAYSGWILDILMLSPSAPTYLSECIVIHALNVLKKEECNYLSLGTLPSLSIGIIKGLNSIYSFFAKVTYKIAKKIFKLQDRQRYWKKFEPEHKPSFVMFSSPYLNPKTIISMMKALNVSL